MTLDSRRLLSTALQSICICLALSGTSQAQTPPGTFDDFNGTVLNTALWTYINPLNDSPLSMTGTQVSISVPGNRNHFTWSGINTAPRIMQAAANTDFEIEVKFDSPLVAAYQMQGVRIEQSSGNSLIVQFQYNGSAMEMAFAHIINSVASTPQAAVIPTGTPMYLRVRREGNQWTLSYLLNGGSWQQFAVIQRAMTVTSVGAFAGNYAEFGTPAHTGVIDYFYKRAVPPRITRQPSSITVAAPSPATFTVEAAGNPAPSYRWHWNGVPIPGATGTSYTVPFTTVGDSGAEYTVTVMNSQGSVTSAPAILTVTPEIINTPPVAVDDAYVVSSGGTILTGGLGVLENDFDADGDPLTAALITNAANGTLTLNADGTFTYVHSGIDQITRQLAPGTGNSNIEFGVATAIDGDTLVVGSNSTEGGRSLAGAAYVFVRRELDWQLQAKLVPPDPVAIHFFGWAVAISGDTIVVGAPGDNHAGQYSGAAYVFVRNGNTWTRQGKITALDARARDEFGTSVAIHQDTIVVGANYHDDVAQDAGAAYVFVRSGTTWSQQTELRAADPTAGALFGLSAAVHGNSVVVGALFEDSLGADAGAAYVFRRSGILWTQEQKLLPSDGAPDNTFGVAVAVQGDRLVVGASRLFGDGSHSGAAYVFDRSGAEWNETQRLLPQSPTMGGFYGFGVSVALHNDTILVGAHGDDEAGANAGAAFVFGLDGSVWTERRKLLASTPVSGGEFGVAVAFAGDFAVIGSNSGKYHVIDRAPGSASVHQIGGTLTDSFTYTARDGITTSNPARVTIWLEQP